MDIILTDVSGFLTKAGWEWVNRFKNIGLTEEHRAIKALLNEIKRRDILLNEAGTTVDFERNDGMKINFLEMIKPIG